jgi:oxygen-independent coproporphyrinogen-3 oxidase
MPMRVQEETIDRKGQMEEFMFLGLRMTEGITRADFLSDFGVDIEAVYGDTL